MAGRFTWRQLMQWEKQAIRNRVPMHIQGLLPRSQVPNNRQWLPRSVSFERNGEKNLLNHLWIARFAAFTAVVLFYFPCHIALWGWTEEVEHHSNNYDNIVYDKLSNRTIPYHAPVGWP